MELTDSQTPKTILPELRPAVVAYALTTRVVVVLTLRSSGSVAGGRRAGTS